jgi:type I restriction enzyme S subunit
LETCDPLSDGGRKIQQKHYLKAGKYEVVDQGEDEIGGYTDDANQLFTGPLPVIVFGDHTRRFKLITRPFAVGADGVKLIGTGPAWNAKCLYFFLRALKFEDRGYSRHFQFVRSAHLPLPPLAEQARISDALDELLSDLDAGVEALQRAQAKLALYRASVLKAAVQGDLTAEWRKQHPDAEPAPVLLQRILLERRQHWEQEQLRKSKAAGKTPPANWKAKYKEPVAPDTTNLPPLPEGWCWVSLDSLLSESLRNGHSAKSVTSANGVPTFSLSAVTYGDFSSRNIKMTSADPQKVKDLWVQPNDIFIERSNAPELVGTARRYTGPADVAIFPDLLIRIRITQIVSVKYVEAILQSDLHRKYFRGHAQGISGSMPKIDQETVERTPIPLCSHPEQEAFVELMDDQMSIIEHIGGELNNKLTGSRSLRQSILRHAFTGQLVPQDPKDEPASELMKRIAAEREGRKKTKAPPRKQTAKRQKREK